MDKGHHPRWTLFIVLMSMVTIISILTFPTIDLAVKTMCS
jgi:hypothetical protein